MLDTSPLLRPNRFVIDLQTIGENTAALRHIAGKQVRFFATLKADAYGFGLIPVAHTVLAAGADALSVVRIEDAVALRQAGIRCPILLYAGQVLVAKHVQAIEQYDLWPAIHDQHSLHALMQHLTQPIGCAIKIECGQERLGVPAETVGDIATTLLASGKLRLEVLHTHPHVVEDDSAHLQWQFDRFTQACRTVQALSPNTRPVAVFAGTRVLTQRRDMLLTGIDPGQALFRLPKPIWQNDHQPSPTPLHLLASTLIHVYAVQRTEHLVHSPVQPAPGAQIGIVPIGYGDGLTKLHAGQVLVRGQRARLITPLSVEYARIDLSNCPQARVGDEVVFIGAQGDDCISPDAVMNYVGVQRVTDLVIPLGSAIPREYLPRHAEFPPSGSTLTRMPP